MTWIDPFTKLWKTSLDRSKCKAAIFNPQLPKGVAGDWLNTYEGFGMEATPPMSGELNDAAPLLRAHILQVICNNDPVMEDYLLTCITQMVRYPWIKLGIVFVLKSKQGAGKNTLLDALNRIFGHHGLELNQARHITGNFNQHLANKICIILNEAVWGGNKQSEGTLKAAITDSNTIIEKKGVDAHSGRNYWNFFISSNEAWCVPATPESRRYVMLPVSDARIGDKAYFKTVHTAIRNGEERELLWFFLNRPCPNPTQWRPEHNMPPRSAALVDQMLQDKTKALLRFLVNQLKEEGCWIQAAGCECVGAGGCSFDSCSTRYLRQPIIQVGRETLIRGQEVLKALHRIAKHDAALRAVIPDQAGLSKFLNETLGSECFKNRARFNAAQMPHDGSTSDKGYWFASAEEIQAHLNTNVLKVPNYFEAQDF